MGIAPKSEFDIPDVETARLLDAGTWVCDDAGEFWCLFQTHMIWHQWMWKAKGRGSYVALDGIPYPLREAEITDGFVCAHRRVQECGQCTRCGAVVGDTEAWRGMTFGAIGLDVEIDPNHADGSTT